MSDDARDGVLFEETGGLGTTADLRMVEGASPVRVKMNGDMVRLSVGVSAGEVVVDLTPERATQLGEALIEGSERVEEERNRRSAGEA